MVESHGRLTWLRNLVVKEMPNLVGVTAMPRLRKRLPLLNSAAAAKRASIPPADAIALFQHVSACGAHSLMSKTEPTPARSFIVTPGTLSSL